MKHSVFHQAIATIAIVLISHLPLLAHDFEVDGIYYNIISSNNRVEVTYKGSLHDSDYNEYTGDIAIPRIVNFNGVTYSVKSISDDAFNGCWDLTSIEIPNSVIKIGNSAFSGCTSLTSIIMGNSVTEIGDYAFRGCNSLSTIETANSLTNIGYGAFSGCENLTNIVIGSGVKLIEDYAFSGCVNLNKITCMSSNPPIIQSYYTFSNYSANLYVPNGCESSYESAEYWELFYNIIELGDASIDSMGSDDIIVTTIDNDIIIKNAPIGSEIRIFSTDGILIKHKTTAENKHSIKVDIKGIYIVTIGNKSFKVMVK